MGINVPEHFLPSRFLCILMQRDHRTEYPMQSFLKQLKKSATNMLSMLPMMAAQE